MSITDMIDSAGHGYIDAPLPQMAGTKREVSIMADHAEAVGSNRVDRDLVCQLWFATTRPDAAAIRAVLAKVHLAGAVHDADRHGTLAFDYAGFALVLRGLAPAAAAVAAMPPHAFAADAAQIGAAQAVVLILRASPVNGALAQPAAVRALAEAALAISSAGDCVAVGWRPAQSVMGCAYFARIMEEWLAGGSFPALGLVSLAVTAGGGLASRGLAVVCGQELEVAPDPGMATADRARVAVRFVDHLATNGPLAGSQDVEIDGFGWFTATLTDSGKKVNLTR